MEKQTGRQDQTGIEFLDKKKQKVDSKIINKALDMFDKMKPNDKQKCKKQSVSHIEIYSKLYNEDVCK